MARRDLNLDDEKRSYSGLWLLCAALLVVGAIWTILDDSFLRRPWKSYQHGYHALAEKMEREKLEAEQAKLDDKDEYQALHAKMAEVEAGLKSPETTAKLADADKRMVAAKIAEGDADLQVRFVKSELEAAWYQYDHAIEHGGNVGLKQKHRDELIAQRAVDEKAWQETQAVVARIQAELDEIHAPVKAVQREMATHETDRAAVEIRLSNMKSVVANIEMAPIATIKQIVLPDFDVNNFEQPVDRVDRCTSCHMGINKAGFEDAPQPWTTHPDQDPLMRAHPPEKFGCTACHGGQGAALNSIDQAHGEVRFWLQPLLRGEQMQARCLNCHRDVERLPSAQNLAEGEYLFEQLGCHGCHLVQGYGDLPRVGPSLRRVSAKVDPQWMFDWILDPYAFRPRTKMPHFEFSEQQSKAVAAYIWSSSKADGEEWLAAHPDPGGIRPEDAAQVAKGEELFGKVGCRACHALAADEVATPVGTGKDYAPNLTNVGEKTTARFIYWWIKDPKGYNPESRMPNLRLTQGEARDITAYLMSLSAGVEKPEPVVTESTLANEELVAEGEAVVRKYGCYGCHAINGMDKESRIGVELSRFAVKPLEELFFGINPEIPRTWNAWTFNKLKNPRIYETEHVEQLMPNFRLSDPDILNLRTWLASRTGALPPLGYRTAEYDGAEKKIQAGRRVLQRYNCTGCHVIDDRGGYVRRLYEDNPTEAPPILNGEGGKVQPEWLYGFLQDPSRQPLRFWLDIRMPTFGLSQHETTSIVDYFAAMAELRDPYFFWDPAVDSTPEMLKTGEALMSDEYFACWACHVRGDETPAGPMEQWAPNLAYAHERLNPDWILSWIKDPQALMPGTKMPAFYPGGPPDVFDGDEDKQVVAMRDYIMSLGAPKKTAKAEEPATPEEAEEQDVDPRAEASAETGDAPEAG
ncbi:MAG: c-type cytochrome [Candidatus Binatia bacterium]|nr:c-type cytochrome [Candidatus Binatia bacterium]